MYSVLTTRLLNAVATFSGWGRVSGGSEAEEELAVLAVPSSDLRDNLGDTNEIDQNSSEHGGLLFEIDTQLNSLSGPNSLQTIRAGIERLGGFREATAKAIESLPQDFLAQLSERFFSRELTAQEVYGCVRQLADSLSAPITEDEFSNMPAVLMRIDNEQHIFIYNRLPIDQKIFSALHEIGHLVLQHPPNPHIGKPFHEIPKKDRGTVIRAEQEADAMAFVYFTMLGGWQSCGATRLQELAESLLNGVEFVPTER